MKKTISLLVATILFITSAGSLTVLAQKETPTLSYNAAHMSGNGLAHIYDGDYTTVYVSEDAPDLSEEKQYFQFDWSNLVKINQLTLYGDFCGTSEKAGQAPTEWKVMLSTDGTNYVEATTVIAEWTDSDELQSKTVSFDAGEGFKSMRVVITQANLDWNHYSINEIELEEIEQETCTINYNQEVMSGTGLSHIYDGDYTTVYVSEDAPDLSEEKQYFQFDWSNLVKINQLTLYGDFCGTSEKAGQAPTEWKVMLSTDGTNYVEATTVIAEWTDSDELQSKTVSFDAGEGFKSMRVVITQANLDWNHYSINEIELEEIEQETCTINYNEEVMSGMGLSHICDGDYTTVYVSENAPDLSEGKQYFQYDWNVPVEKNLVGIYSQFCGAGETAGQAPTEWKILTSVDGIEYKEVSSVSANWYENNELQSKTVKFDAGDKFISMRIVITQANLDWNHYSINEIKVEQVNNDYVIEDLTGQSPVPPPVIPPVETLTVTFNDTVMNGMGLSHLYDGDDATTYVSEDAPDMSDGKQYFQYDWNVPVEKNLVGIYSQFCGSGDTAGQAPTKWKILTSVDGIEYKEVSVVSASWYENDDLQSKTVKFDVGEAFVSMRIVITEANLDWNHYSINEIKVEQVEEDYIINDLTGTISKPIKPESYVDKDGVIQYASCAQISYNENTMSGMGLGFVSDKNKETGYVSEDNPDITEGKQYIQYKWQEPIDINMVTLYSQFCGTKLKTGQAPTEWSILVSSDGLNYKKVCDVKKNWRSNDNIQSKVVQFDTQEDVVALRIVINKANLGWGHYTINEIEIGYAPDGYQASDVTGIGDDLIAAPKTGDNQNVLLFSIILVLSMVVITTSLRVQKKIIGE